MFHSAKVRDANLLDLIPLASLAERYADEVEVMQQHPLCISTLMKGLAATIVSDSGYLKVLEVDGSIRGGLWGLLTNHPWSSSKFAQDIIIVVDTDYRNGSGLLLIRDWIKWAKDNGAQEVYISTASGIATERFIRLADKMGFTSAGHAFRKEL